MNLRYNIYKAIWTLGCFIEDMNNVYCKKTLMGLYGQLNLRGWMLYNLAYKRCVDLFDEDYPVYYKWFPWLVKGIVENIIFHISIWYDDDDVDMLDYEVFLQELERAEYLIDKYFRRA